LCEKNFPRSLKTILDFWEDQPKIEELRRQPTKSMIKIGDHSTIVFNHASKKHKKVPVSVKVVEVWTGTSREYTNAYRVLVIWPDKMESYMVIDGIGMTRRIFVEA